MTNYPSPVRDSGKIEIILRSLYRNIFLDRVAILKRGLADCESVLDLGCANTSPLQHYKVPYSVGVDMYLPYLEESKRKYIHNEYIKADVRKLDFEPDSFDAVLALELLEHLPKKDGYELIRNMERWARKKVIISVPNGYVHQEVYDGNLLQRHLSAWEIDKFKRLGYSVYGFHGWRRLRGYRSEIKYKPVFLWERISDLTQVIAYYYPKIAFQFYAIKKLKIDKDKYESPE